MTGPTDRPDPIEPVDPLGAPLAGRLRRAGTALSRAADDHHRVGATVSAGRPRRRLALAAAAAVIVLGGATTMIVTRDHRPDGPAAPTADCPSGDDLLAVTASSETRDEDHFMGWLSIALRPASGRGRDRFLNPVDTVVNQPTFAPTGDRIAYVTADGPYESAGPNSETIGVFDRTTGATRRLTDGPFDTAPVWSPDGDRIAYVHLADYDRPSELRTVPAAGGPSTLVATAPDGHRWADPAWLPGGDLLVWALPDWGSTDPDATVTLHRRTAAGDDHVVATVGGTPMVRSTLVPGGREVIVSIYDDATRRPRLVAVDVSSGRTRFLAGPAGRLAWSPDGRRLYLQPQMVDADSPQGVFRARYDGTSLALTGTALPRSTLASDVVVGPCADAPIPVTPPTVTGPLLEPVPPTTVAPRPPDAPCAAITAFADRFALVRPLTDRPSADSPAALAARSPLVVRGRLVDAELGAARPPGSGPLEFNLVYRLRVDETLRLGAGTERPGVGDQLPVEVTVDLKDGPKPPMLGGMAAMDPTDPPVPDKTGVPVIAFLVPADDAPGLWRIDGPDALAIGCPGHPVGGLIGRGPGWPATLDLDALAAALGP